MIINGNRASSTTFWAAHLTRDDTNEKVVVHEIKGLVSENLPDALREMEAIADQSRSHGKFMYQANINPRADEHLTPEQWIEAVDTLERNLGLDGHQRVVIEHVKEGRQHYHVVWNRVDGATLKVADIGGNWRTHERTARELEDRFGLTPTPAPERTSERKSALELWEIRAAERSGIDPAQVKAELTELWRSADSGTAFKAAVEDRGYLLAKGDRRDFCVIDQAGDAHSLARRLDGLKVKDVRKRMTDVDREALPSVNEARDTQRAKVRELKPLGQAAGEIRLAWSLSDGVEAFTASLDAHGMTLARVDAQEAAASARANAFAKEIGNFSPRYAEGEIVVVNSFGSVQRLDDRTTGETAADLAKQLASIDAKTLLNVSDARAVMKESARTEFLDGRQSERPLTAVETKIQTLQREALTDGAFAASLYSEGLTLARADGVGIENLARDQRVAFAIDGKGFHSPSPTEGELVAVNSFGGVHRLNPQKLDIDRIERALTGGAKTIPQLGDVREQIETERLTAKEAAEKDSGEFWRGVESKREARQATDQQQWKNEVRTDLVRIDLVEVGGALKAPALVVIGLGGRPAGKLVNFVGWVLGNRSPSEQGPPDQVSRIKAERRAAAALESIRDSMAAGEGLKAEDIYNLTPSHLENIRLRGDDFVRSLVDRMKRYPAIELDYGRERER